MSIDMAEGHMDGDPADANLQVFSCYLVNCTKPVYTIN